jgi:hypothetical protein
MNFSPYISCDRYQCNGRNVPRVTEILSLMHDDYITNWANSLGFRHKNYEEELDFYANIGTIVHDLCDKIMIDSNYEVDYSIYPRNISNQIFNCISGFKTWWNQLNRDYNVEVFAIERPTVCEYYGGTIDVILKINGRLYVGDFKTSNHIGYKYWCQLAAYMDMLIKEGYEIAGCFILQLSKTKPLANNHIVDLSINENIEFMNLAYQTFSGAVYTYYARLQFTQNLNPIYNSNY